MPILQLFLVAVIQGITEFLPISSSGHLILFPQLTGMQDQGQIIDVAVHVGTLGAVVVYFWRDVKQALAGLPELCCGRADSPGARLALGLAIATVPVVLAGGILHFTHLDAAMRSMAVIGWTMLIFGLVLFWADWRGAKTKDKADWGPRDALIMGLCQVLSLIPGTSRSGITITGARMMGYTRSEAARLSMLMSIPAIIASGVLLGTEVAVKADGAAFRDGALAAAFAFVSALLALTLMMRLLRSVSFTPYVVYRVILGIGLLVIAYS